MSRFPGFRVVLAVATLLPAAAPGLAGEAAVTPPHWPLPPLQLEQLLRHEPFDLVEDKPAGGGTTGARRFRVRFPEVADPFLLKWKRVPGRLDGLNNSPRKELAAYQIQKWFLEPEDYIVPTAVLRCIPLEILRRHQSRARATVDGTTCTLGVLSVWVFDVTVPDELPDLERFESDPQYARRLADLNLLTYLVRHQDGREGNFLVSKNGTEDWRVFAIDNGTTFGTLFRNYFVRNWNKIRVPRLRRQSIDRLRELDEEDLEKLAVVAQVERQEDGVLRSVEPGPAWAPGKGARRRGDAVQMGLKEGEIEDLEGRIEQLLEKVDSGRIPVF